MASCCVSENIQTAYVCAIHCAPWIFSLPCISPFLNDLRNLNFLSSQLIGSLTAIRRWARIFRLKHLWGVRLLASATDNFNFDRWDDMHFEKTSEREGESYGVS